MSEHAQTASHAQMASTPVTFIDFLLDETGSMSGFEAATIAGFRDFVNTQKELGGECYLTLSKFDSSSIRTPYVNLSIDMVPTLTFYPGASTNLYDVIGDRLTDVLAQNREGRSLVVILTDGGENASRRHNLDSVRSLITQATQREIVVVYLGPSNSALQVGHNLGIPEGNVKAFEVANIGETMTTLANATKAFRSAATASTSNFF